ncbi:MAG TPA: hypothetical protein VM165_10955, partial [Planctomycetaceae bacterium]|nr:hypothetical protein [Planctomycetaceae bacterium]
CGCFALPSVVTVVRKMFLPATIGEDQPRPGIAVVHSRLEVLDHLSGSLELLPYGFDNGPRKPGHSGDAPASARSPWAEEDRADWPAQTQMATNVNTMSFLIILFAHWQSQANAREQLLKP